MGRTVAMMHSEEIERIQANTIEWQRRRIWRQRVVIGIQTVLLGCALILLWALWMAAQ
jgi:hypothetical protein